MDTVVEIQRKNGVARVKLLSGDTLRVPSALFLERRLHTGQRVDAEAYCEYLRQRGYPHALEAAMKYLALRERSEQEIRARLRRSCYEESVIDQALSALRAHGLVSDRRFSEQWAHSRARKYGKARIARELRVKGVKEQEANAALDAIPEEEEYRRAADQARRLTRKFRGDTQKIAQSLVRKGYSWAMARRATEEAAREEP